MKRFRIDYTQETSMSDECCGQDSRDDFMYILAEDENDARIKFFELKVRRAYITQIVEVSYDV